MRKIALLLAAILTTQTCMPVSAAEVTPDVTEAVVETLDATGVGEQDTAGYSLQLASNYYLESGSTNSYYQIIGTMKFPESLPANTTAENVSIQVGGCSYALTNLAMNDSSASFTDPHGMHQWNFVYRLTDVENIPEGSYEITVSADVSMSNETQTVQASAQVTLVDESDDDVYYYNYEDTQDPMSYHGYYVYANSASGSGVSLPWMDIKGAEAVTIADAYFQNHDTGEELTDAQVQYDNLSVTINAYEKIYDPRYKKLITENTMSELNGVIADCYGSSMYMGNCYLKETVPAGMYDVVFETESGKKYVYTDILCLTDAPVIRNFYVRGGEDATGEYIDITMTGGNLDDIQPVLYNEDGTEVLATYDATDTKCGYYKVSNPDKGTVYRMKKTGSTSWDTAEGYLQCRLQLANDSETQGYYFDKSLYTYATGTLNIRPDYRIEKWNDTDYSDAQFVRIYLSKNWVNVGDTVGVEVYASTGSRDNQDATATEEAVVKENKDGYYVDFAKDGAFYVAYSSDYNAPYTSVYKYSQQTDGSKLKEYGSSTVSDNRYIANKYDAYTDKTMISAGETVRIYSITQPFGTPVFEKKNTTDSSIKLQTAEFFQKITGPSVYYIETVSADGKVNRTTYPIGFISPTVYTITYELNGGTDPENPSSYMNTDDEIELKAPTKEGYSFAGWYDSDDFSGSVYDTLWTGGTTNYTLYAKWNQTSYEAALLSPEKLYLTANGYPIAVGFAIPKEVERAGYLDTESLCVTGSIDGGAKQNYEIKKSDLTSQGSLDGTYTQWMYLGYDNTLTTGSHSMELNVTFTIDDVPYTFHVTGTLECATGTTDGIYQTAEDKVRYFTAKKGQTIKNCDVIMNVSDKNVSLTGYELRVHDTQTVAAIGTKAYTYADESRDPRYNSFAGKQVLPYDTVTLHATLDTMTFTEDIPEGYYDVVCMTSDGKTHVFDSLYYGTEGPTTYDIHYILNGGTNHSANPETYAVADGVVSFATPTRTGYTFAGWYTDEACTRRITSIAAGTEGNYYLYAKWTPNSTVNNGSNNSGNNNVNAVKSYQVTFQKNASNADQPSKSSIRVNTGSAYGTLPTVKRKGYIFSGWYTKASGGTKVTEKTLMGTANVTVYAHWSKVTVKQTSITKVTGGKKQLTVKYKKISGAKGYVIRYSLKKNMKSAKTTTATGTSKTIKKLKANKKYYVQVRAYKLDSKGNKIYAAKWSTVKNTKTK